MQQATYADIDRALRSLGRYRVVRAQEISADHHKIVGGSVLLALGMRETWGRNIEGGAKLVDGRWVPETDPNRMDVGWLQISRRYHLEELREMPGVKAGTWKPIVEGKTAADGGFVPRFTDSLRYTMVEMIESIILAEQSDIPESMRVRFAVAAHNAGGGGALRGFREGNLDKYTAGGDYSAWVMHARGLVRRWIKKHPKFKY